jgi:hypothetical protein
LSVSCFFGLPGCGKTTILTALAQKELKKIRLGKSKYSAVLTNFYCQGADIFNPDSLEKMQYRKCFILIDEVTLVWDSRNFKTFPEYVKQFFTLHRHLGTDVLYATQYYQNVDKRIRDVTSDTYRIRKFGKIHATTQEKVAVKYPEDTGEIIVGFQKPTPLTLLTKTKLYWGPKYYGKFDTHELDESLDRKPLYSGGARRHI